MRHADRHGAAAEAQHETFALSLQMENDVFIVLHPKVTRAGASEREAIAGFAISAGKRVHGFQPIDFASRIDGRQTHPTNAEAVNREGIALAVEKQRAVAGAAASQIS